MARSIAWQLLFVDDDADTCRQVQEYLEKETIAGPDDRLCVETLTDFPAALDKLERQHVDLLILDVRLGPRDDEIRAEEAGIATLDAIKKRRFAPVVFYTALPRLVQHLQTPLIRIVEKTQPLPCLLETVRNIFATHLPEVPPKICTT